MRIIFKIAYLQVKSMKYLQKNVAMHIGGLLLILEVVKNHPSNFLISIANESAIKVQLAHRLLYGLY